MRSCDQDPQLIHCFLSIIYGLPLNYVQNPDSSKDKEERFSFKRIGLDINYSFSRV